jgi:osmotically inducible protein OsmC
VLPVVVLVPDTAQFQLFVRSRGERRFFTAADVQDPVWQPNLPVLLAGPTLTRALLAAVPLDSTHVEGDSTAPVLDLGRELSARVVAEVRDVPAANVGGVLPGTDPARRQELVGGTRTTTIGISVPDQRAALQQPPTMPPARHAAGHRGAFAPRPAALSRIPVLAGEERGLLNSPTPRPAAFLLKNVALINLDWRSPATGVWLPRQCVAARTAKRGVLRLPAGISDGHNRLLAFLARCPPSSSSRKRGEGVTPAQQRRSASAGTTPSGQRRVAPSLRGTRPLRRSPPRLASDSGSADHCNEQTREGVMALAERRARSVWQGSAQGRRRCPPVQRHSGTRRSWAARTESYDGKTSPEELIAGAQAACFSMAFAHGLSQKGHQPQSVDVEATCFLDRVEGGVKITRIHMVLRARVPGLDEPTFKQLAAEQSCPVKNALGNVEFTHEASLL